MTARTPASPALGAAAPADRRPPAAWPGLLSVPRLFLLAGLAAVLIYAASVAVLPRRYGHIVVGDGVHYYVYLRSLVHDGDLDFTNEYEEFNRATTDPGKQINTTLRTPTGRALNMFAAGPALAAAPLYLVAHAVSLAGRAAGLPLPTDGYGPLYEGSFALAGVLASVAAAACAYAVLRRLLAVGPALTGVAALWLGGSLLYYTIASPVYAHAFSALGVAAWCLWWTRLDPRRPRHWLGLGLLGGLMATMRWQEGLFALLPLALWGYDAARGRWAAPGALAGAGGPGRGGTGERGNHPRPDPLSQQAQGDAPRVSEAAAIAPPQPAPVPATAGPRAQSRERAGGESRAPALAAPLAYGLGLALGFAPQLAAWQVLFGAPLAVPQGATFFTWHDPHWLDVLFSTRNGLVTWTPVAGFGVVGLLLLLGRAPRWAAVALAAIAMQVAVNGLLLDWWAGAAFGARRFSGGAVFLALGYGWLAARLWPARRRLALGVTALLIVLNGLLVVQYSAFLKGWTQLDPYPTLAQMTVERVTWPFSYLLRSRR
jgi:hypothetical protein